MTNDPVEMMFTALPDIGSNPVGGVARAALLSRLEGATPGNSSSRNLFGTGPTFLSLFFPNYAAASYAGDVSQATGLGDDFWTGYSIVTLCQAMYNITSDLRKQLKSGDIDNTVNGYNDRLKQAATPLYARAMQSYGPFAQGFNACPDKAQALARYRGHLQSDHYLGALAVQYHGPNGLPNFDWLLWHHWVKLQILGCGTADIASTITAVKNTLRLADVPLPANVDVSAWTTFNNWMNTADPMRRRLDWNDIAGAARPGILARVCYPTYGGYGPSCMNEDSAYEFTANGRPGSPYRSTGGGGCCFAAGTQVLMADGSARPIEEVAAGELVASYGGPQSVLLVARPRRAGRKLYRVDHLPARFTSTHPFALVGEQSSARIASVEPWLLNARVPALASVGIAPLTQGTPLSSFDGRNWGTYRPMSVSEVATQEDEDPFLYDLLLAPGAQPIYLIGGAGTFLAVRSEIPDLQAHAELAPAFLALTGYLWTLLAPTVEGLDQTALAARIERVSRLVANEALPAAARRACQGEALLKGHACVIETEAFLTGMGAGASGEFDWQMNLLVEHLLEHVGERLLVQLERGWREPAKPMAQLSEPILAIELIDLRLFAGTGFGQGAAALRVACHGHEERAVIEHAAQCGGHCQGVGHLYYSALEADGHLPSHLDLEYCTGQAQTLKARVYLPDSLEEGWRHIEALVRAADTDQVVGLCTLDLRLLEQGASLREQQMKSAWGVEQGELYGWRLMAALPDEVSHALTRAALL
ncbi:hypothetical protein [Pseudomonas soli]|uniref:hypothetical protein n=1 Tax=Pseudomonas soli TaxID=1306993 RepID=UPI003807C1A4